MEKLDIKKVLREEKKMIRSEKYDKNRFKKRLLKAIELRA